MHIERDTNDNLVLKENYTFFVGREDGQVLESEHGLYNRDTRFLSRYAWRFGDAFQTLLTHSARPDQFSAHYAKIEGPSQVVGVQRRLNVSAQALTDVLEFENTSPEAQTVEVTLDLAADFADLFEARAWRVAERDGVVHETEEQGVRFRYRAKDGLEFATAITFSLAPAEMNEETIGFRLELSPQARSELRVQISLDSPLERSEPRDLSYKMWREGFSLRAESEPHQAVLDQAIDDLRALLLFTECGLYPSAGIPWYVAAFGRDALLTAYMLLPHQSELARGTLRYLARYQGKSYDDFRAEAPGKIMHELRFGELTRTQQTPHSPYYGTVDAPALFVMLLHEVWQQTGDFSLVEELKPNWEAALKWLQEDGDVDGDSFVEFQGVEDFEGAKGLSVQSWKDSYDSMSHADGTLARGELAVSEVQGYTYAAYRAAATFYSELGDEEDSSRYRDEADTLKTEFHKTFWLDDMQTYAMALDGDKRPLRVHNSDAGQLLWTGIVPEEVAPKLVNTLFSDANWSGWGVRTLGADEVRYNPVSYHNGSVWPHDTALIAGGLARYGFSEEARKIREATFELAASQADKRLPELVAGYPRTIPEGPSGASAPPVPYPVACRPQAWDAAALLYLLRL